MGCKSSRGPLRHANFQLAVAKDIEQSFHEACIIIYGRDSPIQLTPIAKSQFRRLPTIHAPWKGLDVKDIEITARSHRPSKVRLYLKMENFQQTGSFKLRGAYYKITKLYRRQVDQFLRNRLRLVIASTGNHALACAYVANLYNGPRSSIQSSNLETPTGSQELKQLQQVESDSAVDLTIFVSQHAKKEKLKALGGYKIIVEGDDCVEAEMKAREHANEQLCYYVSPYNDIDIVAATATIGLELYEFFAKYSRVDYVFVSVGGGGLISGLAFYFHYIKNEQTKIIGVQPQGNSCMWNSIQRKGIDSETTLVPTLSDATDGGIEDGSITYDICSRLVDEWVIVSESELVNGLRELAQTEKLIVEGSAGLAYAGAMKYLSQNPILSENDEINAVVILCGQNIGLENHAVILGSKK